MRQGLMVIGALGLAVGFGWPFAGTAAFGAEAAEWISPLGYNILQIGGGVTLLLGLLVGRGAAKTKA